MATAKRIKLARIPRSLLRPDLERRLPKGNQFADLSGRKLQSCKVIGLAGFIGDHSAWLCRCDCGKQFVSRANSLLHVPTGCGCAGGKQQKHGGSNTAEYDTWLYLLKKHRGEVCERWLLFEAFRADVTPRPKDRRILCRSNAHKPYGPHNFEWRSGHKQARRNAKSFTYNGESMQLKDWARRLGLTYEGLRKRILKCERDGRDISEALEPSASQKPSRGRPRKR